MTVDEMIEILGRADICARLHVSGGAIANAKKRGAFPAKWMFVILNMAFDKGLSVPLSVFGCDPDPQAEGKCVSSCALDVEVFAKITQEDAA